MNIKNLTNSPYPITLANGEKTILPARGSLEGVEVDAASLAQIKACGYITVSESAKLEKPGKNPSTERTRARKDGKDGGGKK